MILAQVGTVMPASCFRKQLGGAGKVFFREWVVKFLYVTGENLPAASEVINPRISLMKYYN